MPIIMLWKKLKMELDELFVLENMDYSAHPEEAIIIISALGAVYGFGRKIYRDVKPSSTDKILKRQETMIYDPNCKVWWPIKHKMSTSQKLEFEHRRKFNGETVSEALRHMKLLKH